MTVTFNTEVVFLVNFTLSNLRLKDTMSSKFQQPLVTIDRPCPAIYPPKCELSKIQMHNTL